MHRNLHNEYEPNCIRKLLLEDLHSYLFLYIFIDLFSCFSSLVVASFASFQKQVLETHGKLSVLAKEQLVPTA